MNVYEKIIMEMENLIQLAKDTKIPKHEIEMLETELRRVETYAKATGAITVQ